MLHTLLRAHRIACATITGGPPLLLLLLLLLLALLLLLQAQT
jgi:hypothetical protein